MKTIFRKNIALIKNFLIQSITEVLKKIQSFERRFYALIHDIIIALITIPMVLWLRQSEDFCNYPTSFIIKHMIVYGLLSLGIYLWVQLYRGIWRYVSLNEVIVIGESVTYITFLYWPLMWLMNDDVVSMPRSIIPLSWMFMLLALSGARFAYRLLYERFHLPESVDYISVPQSRVLLLGATNQAEMFIRDLLRTTCPLYEVIGIIDTEKGKVGRYIHGIEIMGLIDDIPLIIEQLNNEGRHPHHLVIADTHMRDQKCISHLLDVTNGFKIDLARLPNLDHFTRPGPYGLEIKPIQIEDLLNRAPVSLDRKRIKSFISGKRILITGAGGTIGGELVRQIASLSPDFLILLDHSEYLLYTIEQELNDMALNLESTIVLGDVTQASIIDDVVKHHKPHIIFHAAAIKHVPMAESHPHQAIMTNIIGTQNVAEVACKYHVETVVFISTDKAVRPTNIMGATKRVAESLCQALDAAPKPIRTRFITTRFGNVLGSTGSVIPLFKKQLAMGGPLTVTHPDITRYFMTVFEAVELVLNAAVMGHQSTLNRGQIFVLDMGEPVKILSLAEQMIQLAGLRPHKDIKIDITGLRAGDKLYEELFLEREKMIQTECLGLMLASPPLGKLNKIKSDIAMLEAAALARDTKKCRQLLESIVVDYTPT